LLPASGASAAALCVCSLAGLVQGYLHSSGH